MKDFLANYVAICLLNYCERSAMLFNLALSTQIMFLSIK